MAQKPKTKLIDMSSETEVQAEPQEKNEAKQKERKATVARVRGKKYNEKKALVNRDTFYSIPEAVSLVKQTSYSKFDGTVELHLLVKREGINVSVTLPHSGGKQKRVAVVNDDILEELKNGKVNFDVLLATPDMMPKLVPFARLLGPKGLMPNPKNGTLIKDASQASKFSGNTLSVKTERKAPLIHTSAGKVSQNDRELIENIEAILGGVGRRQILKAYIKPTMGPSIKLSL